jgi:hypothetical protein
MFLNAGEQDIHHVLSDTLVCKGDPAEAVYGLVQHGSNFSSGYAAHGFGDDTSYKAVVVWRGCVPGRVKISFGRLYCQKNGVPGGYVSVR